MHAYTLTVLHPETPTPTEIVSVDSAVEAMASVTTLLVKHPGGHRIHVEAGSTHLFSVDGAGEAVTR